MKEPVSTLIGNQDSYSVVQKLPHHKKHKLIVIGLGNQARKDHIPAILRRDDVEIVALVDKNVELLEEHGRSVGAKVYSDLEAAIRDTRPDVAIVSIPHNEYFGILEILARNHVATLKEKPLAMTYEEAKKIISLYQSHDTYLQICVQRRFSKLYDTTKELLDSIGRIYSAYVEYTLNLSAAEMENGWRADRVISGGGAALDMGYHSIDLLTYLFGVPDRIYAQLNYNSLSKKYTIEDSMKAMMTYCDGQINTNVVVTKIFSQKSEKARIFGANGAVYVDGRTVTLLDKDGSEVESHSFNLKQHEVDSQLDYFLKRAGKRMHFDAQDQNLIDQLSNMRTIDAIYKSHNNGKAIKLR